MKEGWDWAIANVPCLARMQPNFVWRIVLVDEVSADEWAKV
ncbi:hypothetical protein [Halomicronema sp. CCY15110]|nr:hypothetical protein [Halomicronema sp. CCY15110]